jgi:hypothetical protein
VDPRRGSPVWTGGQRAAPPEDCGGTWADLQRVDQHHVPLEAMAIGATALERVLQADVQTSIRPVIGDAETFQEAGELLDASLQFQPERFDRRQVNRQLREGKPS